jgi:hypothetical protein
MRDELAHLQSDIGNLIIQQMNAMMDDGLFIHGNCFRWTVS